MSGKLTELTGQIHINGYKWGRGHQCRYRLPTDLRSNTLFRIGVLDKCTVVPTNAGELLFAYVVESHLFNTINGMDIVDVTHASPRTSIIHFIIGYVC